MEQVLTGVCELDTQERPYELTPLCNLRRTTDGLIGLVYLQFNRITPPEVFIMKAFHPNSERAHPEATLEMYREKHLVLQELGCPVPPFYFDMPQRRIFIPYLLGDSRAQLFSIASPLCQSDIYIPYLDQLHADILRTTEIAYDGGTGVYLDARAYFLCVKPNIGGSLVLLNVGIGSYPLLSPEVFPPYTPLTEPNAFREAQRAIRALTPPPK